MPHDTSKDSRLLVAEAALRRLQRLLPIRHGIQPKLSKQQTVALLKGIESNLMTCKFMYLDPAVLAEQEQVSAVSSAATRLQESVDDLFRRDSFGSFIRAELRWCFQILRALPERLRREGTTMASGIDLLTVRVQNVTKKDKLWLTRVDAGTRELTVVTNMSGITPGQVLAAALLPPVELAGTTSEAMFLGNQPRQEPPGTLLGERDVDAREAASILHEELSR